MTKIQADSIKRRDFLCALGSASLLAPVALGMPTHTPRTLEVEASTKDSSTELLSVGYWVDSEGRLDIGSIVMATRPSLATARPGPGESDLGCGVIPAARLASGDSRFCRTGARVTIHGLHEADASLLRPAVEGLSAVIHFQVIVDGVMTNIPCSAWHFQRSPVRNASPPVGMMVPVDRESALRLTVERGNGSIGLAGRVLGAALLGRRAESGVPSIARGDVSFTLGDEPHLPKLRRGVYFIASQSRSGRSPAWGQYRFDEVGDGRALVRYGVVDKESADFDYLVMSVDHAPAEKQLIS